MTTSPQTPKNSGIASKILGGVVVVAALVYTLMGGNLPINQSSDKTSVPETVLQATTPDDVDSTTDDQTHFISISESGTYTSKDEVALYIHTYGKLPSNYISKTKARRAGWIPEEGNLWDVLPGKSIGGGPFYNDDGLLPDAEGRTWKECDIDYRGESRGAKRIVFSNDGLIYYTPDHYETFERLY